MCSGRPSSLPFLWLVAPLWCFAYGCLMYDDMGAMMYVPYSVEVPTPWVELTKSYDLLHQVAVGETGSLCSSHSSCW